MPLPTWWSSSIKAMSKSSRSRTRSNSVHRESQISFDDGCEGYQTILQRPDEQHVNYQTDLVHTFSPSNLDDRIKNRQDLEAGFDSGPSSRSSSLFMSPEREKRPPKMQSALAGGLLKPFGSKPAMSTVDDILGYESPPRLRARKSKRKSKSITGRRKDESTIVPPVPPLPEIHLPSNHSSSTLSSPYRARADSATSWATTHNSSHTLSSIDLGSQVSRVGSQSSRFALDDGYSVDEWGSSSVSISIEQSTSQRSLPPPRLRSLSLPQTAACATQSSFPDFPLVPSPSSSSFSSSSLPHREGHPIAPVRSHSLPARNLSDSYLPTSATASDPSRMKSKYASISLRRSPRPSVFQSSDQHNHSQSPVISPPLFPHVSEPLISPTSAPRVGKRKSSKMLTALFSSGSKTEPAPGTAGPAPSMVAKRKNKGGSSTAEPALGEKGAGAGAGGSGGGSSIGFDRYQLNSPKGSFFRKKRTPSVEQEHKEEEKKEVKSERDRKKASLSSNQQEGDKGENKLRRSYESDIKTVTAKLLPLFTLPLHTTTVLEPPSAALQHSHLPSPCGSSASEPVLPADVSAAKIAASTLTGLGLSYPLPVGSELRPSFTNRPSFVRSFEPVLLDLPHSPSSSYSSSPPLHETPTHKSSGLMHTSPISALELTPTPNSPTPTIVPATYSKENRPLPSIPPFSVPLMRNGLEESKKLFKSERSNREISNTMDPARSSLESEGESLVLLYLPSNTLSD